MTKQKNKPLTVRGKIFEGRVTSTKMPKTVVVERNIFQYVPKYERYKKTRSKIKAHVPENIKVSEGDWVRIGETRKISKTKSFLVLEVVKKSKEEKNESH
ncbi:30S ribosomal protein S17 [Candidatus Micrarchaeota archaeon]|nr:30S ribosomal protein S17 [Candidatus Micrarchaeota archaeon]MBU1930739.1 30S ribosomal protein S17 [Candidatus Micrarchaeota archaeon]